MRRNTNPQPAMKTELTLASMATLDDCRVAVALNQALRRVEDDLRDRPAVKTIRKVSLVIEMKPSVNDKGELEEIGTTFKIQDNLPKRESRSYSMIPAKKGQTGILFNDESLDDGRQGTLDDAPIRSIAGGGR